MKVCARAPWEIPLEALGQSGSRPGACRGARLAHLKPPCPPQPVSWASTSRPLGTSSAPAAPCTATLQPLLPRPAAVTSATTAQPWTRHPQPAPVSTTLSPRIRETRARPGPRAPRAPGSQCSTGEAGTGGSLGPGAGLGWEEVTLTLHWWPRPLGGPYHLSREVFPSLLLSFLSASRADERWLWSSSDPTVIPMSWEPGWASQGVPMKGRNVGGAPARCHPSWTGQSCRSVCRVCA